MANHMPNVQHCSKFISDDLARLLNVFLKKSNWYIVKYKSKRHGNQCTTPCLTNVLFSFKDTPLADLACLIERHLKLPKGYFNVALIRLYKDGSDNIAWHTDSREYLGCPTTVASISLGASREFQMKHVGSLWGQYEKSEDIKTWTLKDRDLFVMQGDTQEHWHHRIKPDNSIKTPRFNINFRHIIDTDSRLLQKGKNTYYRYCVAGDSECPCIYKYSDIIKTNTITNYFKKK